MRLLPWLTVAALVAGCGAGASGPADAGGADAPPAADAPTADGPPPCDPAAPGGTSPDGYPLDGWRWDKVGLLWDLPAGLGAGDGDLAPSLLAVGSTLHLFFTRKTGLTHRIHHTASPDGVTWPQPAAPATGLGDDPVVAYPAALHEDGRFRLWFGSGSIDLAESADGDAWTVVAPGVLRAGASGAFDGLSVLYPAIARDAAGYHLFYTGFDGQRLAIGRADAADGLAFTRAASAPVLTRGAAAELDNHAVAQPAVVRTTAGFLLWYGAYDTAKTDPGPYRVALAASADGVTFVKRGLTLDLSADRPDAWSTRDPAVVRTADGWVMVYAGMGTDSKYRLMRATSRTCAPAAP
ncbi:MAG TPA: hypothetical protein VGQ83_25735 [Polyangia bacterium]|jgi:hypothetical protein